MRARMIHELDGACWSYAYGTKGQHINSVERARLNQLLLAEADKYPNVTIYFDHKLSMCDFDNSKITLLHDNEKITHKADLVIGCDGSYSLVRQEMLKRCRLDFSQSYIPHGYVEISMPGRTLPSGATEPVMPFNYLHIWPRKEFMLIGLPNLDNSFTGTLFMPFKYFDALQTGDDALNFFQEMFPDFIKLFGSENLLSSFKDWKVAGLVSIRCSTYNYKDRCVLMGDAAHAMVPFYGQGMNCGLEDCLVFKQALDTHPHNLEAALDEYSRLRVTDAFAINDLAMYNYIEMRSKVNSKLFLLRRRVDSFLHWLMPNTWIPLYTTVSFTRIPYHLCVENKSWQDMVVNRLLLTGLLGGVAVTAGALWKWLGHRSPLSVNFSWKSL
ncbi:KMO [Bugula neritina]|uniref:KMO n=1 Tax=Bugula neritina TaxID=10212 RepID=A0A7J7JGD4_BUGNE|nr:KMO [Bugula neritina]